MEGGLIPFMLCGPHQLPTQRGYFHACAYVMEHCILFCEQLMLMIKGFIQNQLNQEKENKNSLVLG